MKGVAKWLKVVACQTSQWPVFYDPDHLAADFLQLFFPGAVRLTMGAADFQKDLLQAISARGELSSLRLAARGQAGPSNPQLSEVLGQAELSVFAMKLEVVLIENAYLPACDDLLHELSGLLASSS